MKKLLQERIYTLAVTIVIISVAASVIYPGIFPTFANLRQVLLNLSIDTIVAVGMMLLLISGSFDLSVGSVVAFAGCLAANLMFFHDINVFLSTGIALFGALAIGFINGYLVAYVGVNAMIQTLAMMGIVRGLALLVSGAGIQSLPYWYNAIGQSKLLSVQMPVWYMLFIVALFSFLFIKQFSSGGIIISAPTKKAAMLSGIKVKRMKLYGFIITSLLAGFAGILLSSRLGAALSTSGSGMELRVITAVILGGASLQGGQGKIIGALLGSLFMGIVGNIMIIARVSGYWQQIILGVILILSICIDLLLKKERTSSAVINQ